MSTSYANVFLIILALFLLIRVAQSYGKHAGHDAMVTSMKYPNPTIGPAGWTQANVAPNGAVPGQVGVAPSYTGAVTGPSIVAGYNRPPDQSISTGTVTASLLGSAKEALSVQPVDYDALFSKKDVQPHDLIPKLDPALYGGSELTPDMDQNFMQRDQWQVGLPTSNNKKYIADIRQIYPNPITVVGPFGNPTSFPDIQRRSLCDL